MNTTNIGLLVLGLIALAAVVWLLRKRPEKKSLHESSNALAEAESSDAAVEQEAAALFPAAIHFGHDLANPAVTLRSFPLSDLAEVSGAPIIKPSLGVAARISALMQAAPSVLVAEAHRGRKLMEVVINGELTRAADGNGYRAMSIAGNRITENARLFETKDLSNLVNAAAVWQLASVVVAQKHLADISQKLGEIKEAVGGISEFLDSGRRAVIHGTYEYLKQGYETLAQGELSLSIRTEIESCERELLKVQDHLLQDIQRCAQVVPADDDTFGTESLRVNSIKKYSDVRRAVEDLKACIKTRALAWFVLSLYPGEHALKETRRKSVEDALDSFRSLQSLVDQQGTLDVGRFKSMWNRDGTLEARRAEVLAEASAAAALLEGARADTLTQLRSSQARLIERDGTTHLVIELIDGKVATIRQREREAA